MVVSPILIVIPWFSLPVSSCFGNFRHLRGLSCTFFFSISQGDVSILDGVFQVKLNEIVNPNKAVADYRSEITGITAKDLDGVTCSVADIQVIRG